MATCKVVTRHQPDAASPDDRTVAHVFLGQVSDDEAVQLAASEELDCMRDIMGEFIDGPVPEPPGLNAWFRETYGVWFEVVPDVPLHTDSEV